MADNDKRADVDENKPLMTEDLRLSSSKHVLDNSREHIYKDGYMKTPPTSEENINNNESKNGEEEKIEVELPNKTELEFGMNTRALPKHAKTYQLEHFQKNAMIIFNQHKIDGYDHRVGTEKDEKALRDTFSKLGFEIEPPHIDLTKIELFDELKNFSDKDFTDYGCVVIVIMTHGEREGLLRAKDVGQLYSEQDILNHFKTERKPTLFTKPVILIIQACRGKDSSKSVAVNAKTIICKDHAQETPYYIPVEADMLIFHSSYANKVSYRPVTGTWFIQTLCKKINKLYRTHDLISILTEVQREIAIEKYTMEYNRITDKMDIHKQMPVITSTLTRKLYLHRLSDLSAGEMSTTWSQSDCEDTVHANCTCLCYFEHFEYMTTCLSHIVKSNPSDQVARGLLYMSNEEARRPRDDDVKTKRTLALISNYLLKYYKSSEYHKYIHFYSNEYDTDAESLDTKGVVKRWTDWTPKYFAAGLGTVGTCMGGYLIYNLLKLK